MASDKLQKKKKNMSKKSSSSSSDEESSSSGDESGTTTATTTTATSGTTAATSSEATTSGSGTNATTSSSGTEATSTTTATTTTTAVAEQPPAAAAAVSSSFRASQAHRSVSFAVEKSSSSSSEDSSSSSSDEDSDSDEDSESTATTSTDPAAPQPPLQKVPQQQSSSSHFVPAVVTIAQQSAPPAAPSFVPPALQATAVPKPSSRKSSSSSSDDSDSDEETDEASETTTATTTTTTEATETTQSSSAVTTSNTATTTNTTATGTTTTTTTASKKPSKTTAVKLPAVAVAPLPLQHVPQQPPPLYVSVPHQAPPAVAVAPVAGPLNSMKAPADGADLQPGPSSTAPTAASLQGPTSTTATLHAPTHGNQRYGEESVTSSSDTEEAAEEEDEESSSSSEDTSSTITEADALAVPPRAKPTKVIRVIRDTETVVVASTTQAAVSPSAEPFLPMELMIAPDHDIISQLIDRLLQRQRLQQEALLASGGEAATNPPSTAAAALPQNHVTRANAFVACRAISLSDTDSATLLFGTESAISVPFLRSLLEKELRRVVRDAAAKAFQARDKFKSGELHRGTVCRLIEQCGFGKRIVADGAVSVCLRASGDLLMAFVTHTVPSSNPPQVKEITVETQPRTFQLFVDHVRGEVTCNGVPVCTRVLDSKQLSEVVQVMQSCVYISSLVDAYEIDEGERSVAYEPLLKALLAESPPAMLGAAPPADQAAALSRSVLQDNAARSLVDPLSHIEEASATTHIEPFLKKSTALPERRRLALIPQSLQQQGSPSPSGQLVSFDIFVPQVRVSSSLAVPVAATRYLIISTVSATNVVLPGVRVVAKPVEPSEAHVWHFSKKKVRNHVFLAGDPSDTLYVEVCYDTKVDEGNGVLKEHTRCAGFATCSLATLKSGTLAVKHGTFFRRVGVPDAAVDRVADETTGCGCFSSGPSTRISIEVDSVSSSRQAGWSSLGQERIVILERHVDVISRFRELLISTARAEQSSVTRCLRSQITQAAFSVVDHVALLDLLCECWDRAEKSMKRDQRNDRIFVDQQLSDLLTRVVSLCRVVTPTLQMDDPKRWEELVMLMTVQKKTQSIFQQNLSSGIVAATFV